MEKTDNMQNRKERWDIAQKDEKIYWARRSRQVRESAKDLSYFKTRADSIVSLFDRHFTGGSKIEWDRMKILEVGSGPIGVVNYIRGECYAVDPLMDFYNLQPDLITNRSNRVKYIQGAGEDLPFPDRSFDIAIIINVLDHCMDPEKVLREIKRVLLPGGLLYFVVNARSLYGYSVRNMFEKMIHFDKGHPHSYTQNKIVNMLEKNFEIIDSHMETFPEKLKRINSNILLREYLKTVLGINGYRYTSLVRTGN